MPLPSAAFLLLFALLPAFNGVPIEGRNDGSKFIPMNSTLEQRYPVCQWRGTAPFCKGECNSNEVQNTKSDYEPKANDFGARCWTGVKAYCCLWHKQEVQKQEEPPVLKTINATVEVREVDGKFEVVVRENQELQEEKDRLRREQKAAIESFDSWYDEAEEEAVPGAEREEGIVYL